MCRGFNSLPNHTKTAPQFHKLLEPFAMNPLQRVLSLEGPFKRNAHVPKHMGVAIAGDVVRPYGQASQEGHSAGASVENAA